MDLNERWSWFSDDRYVQGISGIFQVTTLPETSSLLLKNQWLEDEMSFFGMAYFQGGDF